MGLDKYLSATDLLKKTGLTIDALEKGGTEKLIILRNNAPKAILLTIDAYEAMEEELEDLHLTALALARKQTFQPNKAISHSKMMERHGK